LALGVTGMAEFRDRLITTTVQIHPLRGNTMSKHEKEDPRDKYVKNGYERRNPPDEDPGGKHQEPDTDDKNKDDTDKK
jgi:hypothetical protein